jgi:hypothetical protein
MKMSNDTRDITSRAETALTTASYFEKYGQAASGRRFVGDLLKFGKDGVYVAGQENREIATGTQMVAYMSTLRAGWVCWEDGHPVEEVMGLVGEGFVPPKRDALDRTDKSRWEEYDGGEPRDPWQFSNDIVLFDPRDEQFYTFVTSSRGGLGALGELAKKYGQRLRQQPGEWPVVALEGGSYQHRIRSRGRIKYPILHDVRWVAAKDQPALVEGAGLQQIEQDQSLPGF